MLASGAAEAASVYSVTSAALDRYVRSRSPCSGNFEKARVSAGALERPVVVAISAANAENFSRTIRVNGGRRSARILGKNRWIEFADHHIAVGRKRSAPVRCRSGRRSRFGSDAKARTIECADGAPPAATVWMRIIGARRRHRRPGDERALVLPA
jgi:hypothetical protein